MLSRGRGGPTTDPASTRIPAAHRKMQEAQFFFSRLGRKPPADTLLSAAQVHRFLQGGTHFRTWRDALPVEDRDFLLAVLGQRDLETHGRGILVGEQEHQFEPVVETGWLAELVPERFFVIGDRRYGASFVASHILGLLATFLAHVEGHARPNTRRAQARPASNRERR